MIKLTLPNTIRSKKNSRQPITIPAKAGSKSTLFKMMGGKMRKVQLLNIPSKAHKKWEREARKAVESQITGQPTNNPVTIKAVYYYKGKKPDLSGCHESLADCLEGLVYHNDRQIERWHGDSRLVHDKENPRTEVEIWIWKEHK